MSDDRLTHEMGVSDACLHLLDAGMGPGIYAAAGLDGAAFEEILLAVAASQDVLPAYVTAAADHRAALEEVRRLEADARVGRTATEADGTLPDARTHAEALGLVLADARADLLAFVVNEAAVRLDAAGVAVLERLITNRDRGVSVEFKVLELPEHEWALLERGFGSGYASLSSVDQAVHARLSTDADVVAAGQRAAAHLSSVATAMATVLTDP